MNRLIDYLCFMDPKFKENKLAMSLIAVITTDDEVISEAKQNLKRVNLQWE